MVAFDVDGVLADSVHGFTRWAQRRLGVADAELGPFDDYTDFLTRWPAHHHEALGRLFCEVYVDGAHGVYDQSAVIEGALDGVWSLHEAGLASGFVTRRPSALHRLTRDWLTRAGFPTLPLRHADGGLPKAPRVRDLGALVMVEDSPVEAEDLAAAGVRVLLRHEPYNARVERAGVVRCAGWAAVLEQARVWLPNHHDALQDVATL